MIIKIVGAGTNDFKNLYRPDPGEFLVGVDGGIYSIIDKGLDVDLAIGDFDSCNINEVIAHCSRVITFPPKKDHSDLELAIREIASMRAKRIEIYNATGGRLDHFIAALNVLVCYAGYNIEMFDERNHIYILRDDTMLKKTKYKYYSFFAIETGTIISLTGFKYELHDYKLSRHDNLCLSNEITKSEAVVRINGRAVLVIETI